MASTSTVVLAKPRSVFGVFLLAFALLVVFCAGAYFYAVAVARYSHFDAAHYGHHWLTRWWLVAHLTGGSLALVLGPFQFIGAIRRRHANIHRWMGRTYLFGILAGSLSAIYMCFFVETSRAFGVSLFFLAVAWIVTSLMGLIAVLCRQFAAHREWMIRSYVVTFGFVVFRLLAEVHVFSNFSRETDVVTRGWICWAVPLLITEVVLQWKSTVGAKIPARQT